MKRFIAVLVCIFMLVSLLPAFAFATEGEPPETEGGNNDFEGNKLDQDNQNLDNQNPDNQNPDNQNLDNQNPDNQNQDNQNPDNQNRDNQDLEKQRNGGEYTVNFVVEGNGTAAASPASGTERTCSGSP